MNVITALAGMQEGPLNTRRTDPEDVRAIAEGLRRVEDSQRRIDHGQQSAHARVDAHEGICAERYKTITEKLVDLKEDHRILRRNVLGSLIILAGIDLMGGHQMVQSLLARVGIIVSVNPSPAIQAAPPK